MLKIWKQAWRKEDAATSSQGPDAGKNNSQDAQMSGTDGGGTSEAPAIVVPPVFEHHVLGPITSTKRSSLFRRTRTIGELEPSDRESTDRPVKRQKIEESTTDPSDVDLLASHLPEVIEIDNTNASSVSTGGEMHQARRSEMTFPMLVIDHAKQENTIAVLDSHSLKVQISSQLLSLACDNERVRPHAGISRRRRVAVVAVDDIAFADIRAAELVEHSNLSIGVYNHVLHTSRVSQWSELVNKDVVVLAANHLLEALVTGSVAISQIHLLVIDDALAIKGREVHPMYQVMRDFFRITDPLSRPRIYGTILLQTDSKFYFDVGVLKLERIFDAKIFGISGHTRAEEKATPNKPKELVVFYDPQLQSTETPLFKQLRAFDPHESIFRRQFRNSRHALTEVGSCASDLVWRRALKEIDASTEIVYEEDDDQVESTIAIAKAKSSIRNAVKNWVFSMPNLDPTSRSFNVTPKFAKLVQILKASEPQGDTFRGIIFVQRRSVAYVIADVLRTLDDYIGFLRPQVIVGHGPSSESSLQQDVLEGFRIGTYNLLVATKYAEDLEIAPSTIVIRFDIFESHVSYAHCRARTRGRESHLIHMAERGSDVHRRILSQIARLDDRMEEWIEKVTNSPGSAVPPCMLRETTDPYRSDSDDEDDDPVNFLKDPTTGGRIYRQDATTVLYRFMSHLQQNGSSDTLTRPIFEFEELSGGLGDLTAYICTVLLPSGTPLSRVSGPPCDSMSEARRTACHQTCLELFGRGLLDYRLFPRPSPPTFRRQRASYVSNLAMEEISDREDDESYLPAKAKQGQSKSTGTRSYPRKKPDFWSNTLPIMRGCLYPTIVTPVIRLEGETEGPFAPMIILTRLPLPPIASFKLFFSGVAGSVHMIRGAAFEVDDDRLHDLYRYTIRICRSITNKPLVCSMDNMAYFLAPLPLTWEAPIDDDRLQWSFPDVTNHIPWDLVNLAATQSVVPLKSQNLETMIEDTKDAVIQDRWVEFTRRYICAKMRPDLNPLSKPEDSPRERNYENLVEYCKARRKGFEGLQNYKQPLIEVTRAPTVLNLLNPTSRPFADSQKHPAKYLIPELCAKFTVPASTFRTAFLMPSVLRRLDDILLVKELNAKFFDHSILEHHLHAAVSAPSSAVDVDYERLELLGDAYLKYLSSIYLFVTNPSQHEGALHIARQRIISNRSLLRNADRSGLPQYIQSKPFTSKLWAPPNFTIARLHRIVQNEPKPSVSKQIKEDGEVDEGGNDEQSPRLLETLAKEVETDTKGHSRLIPQGAHNEKATKPSRNKRAADEEEVQWLGDKGVADVAEAIIGAAYITGGREVALKVTKAINVPVPHIDRWSDFGRKALAPPPEVTSKLRDGSVQAVEAIIGHKFERPHLLAQALTHASIHGNEMTCYERLEFIGDAILDFLVIRHIFDRDGNLSPGALTLLKGAMVSNSTLAAVCAWSGLHEHLLFESYNLANSIQAYADELRVNQTEEYKLAAKENRSPGQYWLEVEPPKALSDVVESILGAVYVSDNFSPVGAETFFDKVLKPFYDKHITLQTLSHHPTKILFEVFQSQGCQEFEIIKEQFVSDEGPHTVRCDVIVHDIILASATDTTSTFAARRASFWALDALEGDPNFMTRTCDCRALTQARKMERKAQRKAARSAEYAIEEVEEMVVEGVLDSDTVA